LETPSKSGLRAASSKTICFATGFLQNKLSDVDFAKRKGFEIDYLLVLEMVSQHKWQAQFKIPTHTAITVPKRSASPETGEQIKKSCKNQSEIDETTKKTRRLLG
tara:strand:+ start:1575 stop:1889 length:315 start_codon:yes stop_codon:yes gene_type:complete